MSTTDLKIALLSVLFIALYVNVRARGLNNKFRRAAGSLLLVAALAAMAALPAIVFSLPDAPVRFDARTGAFLLAAAQRPAFAFDAASGLSNRFITPNGDGRNDFAVFTFANPRDAEIIGRVFDLRGALVAELAPHPLLNARIHRVWDGKSNGAPAAPGVYIYRIEAEDKAFTGTVTVVR